MSLAQCASRVQSERDVIDLEYLSELRRQEMERIATLIPKKARVLEVGAGTGEQARYLANQGYDVVALDLANSDYSRNRVFPVLDYDGTTIPIGDAAFDVIFSSNVLEHVENLPQALSEFRRLLRPGGLAIHAVPTPAWRFWTFASSPFASVAAVRRMIEHLVTPPPGASRIGRLGRNAAGVLKPLIPAGHGTSREGISELWKFSAPAWRQIFRRNGWVVESEHAVGLFYTGHNVAGLRLRFAARQRLSRLLGSAARIYVIRPADAAGVIAETPGEQLASSQL